MAKEYIEREAAVKTVVDALNQILGIVSQSKLVKMALRIREIPTADVVEVRHGKWVDNHNGTFTCSVCGGQSSKMDYCGRCGAKMDGKDDEQ